MKSKYSELVRNAINQYWRENHSPPTYDEMMRMTGVRSKSHYASILDALVTEGQFRYDEHKKPVPAWVDDMFDKERE
jgi:SOS-response transcriptional repressor LexA